jgi:rhamnogalacturonan acetylesterase
MRFFSTIFAAVLILVFSLNVAAQKNAEAKEKTLPTVFLVGDSTVNNSTENFVGWGNVIGDFFDKTKINVVNRARGGRSSRTFFTEDLWEQVLSEMKSGDFVLIQFGHNDGGAIDKEKFRGSIRGTGEETQEITGANGRQETVRTFGWYVRKFVRDAKAKGATPILLSPVPRNKWKDGKVERASADYGKWAAEIARSENVLFVDLNEITARKYEKAGAQTVGAEYFTVKDHTHTSAAGARMNAESVVEGLRNLKNSPLKKYILKQLETAKAQNGKN